MSQGQNYSHNLDESLEDKIIKKKKLFKFSSVDGDLILLVVWS